jgi:hypothetical protein
MLKPWEPWTDINDQLSFTKLLITAFVVAIFMQVPLQATIVALLIAAAFGKSTFEKWLERTQFEVKDTTERNIKEGYEPTP